MAWCDHSDYYMLQKLPKLGEKNVFLATVVVNYSGFVEVSIQPKSHDKCYSSRKPFNCGEGQSLTGRTLIFS